MDDIGSISFDEFYTQKPTEMSSADYFEQTARELEHVFYSDIISMVSPDNDRSSEEQEIELLEQFHADVISLFQCELSLSIKEKRIMTLKATLETFLKSDDFKKGVIASTRASWGGGGYSVELFLDGSWRVLDNNQIGNKYEAEGVILRLPPLNSNGLTEWLDTGESEEDFFNQQFDNEYEELTQIIRESLD